MALSCIISDKAKHWLKISIFSYRTCIRRPQLRGDHHPNTAMRFGIEKLERFGYPMVKKFVDTFICFDTIPPMVRETDILQQC